MSCSWFQANISMLLWSCWGLQTGGGGGGWAARLTFFCLWFCAVVCVKMEAQIISSVCSAWNAAPWHVDDLNLYNRGSQTFVVKPLNWHLSSCTCCHCCWALSNYLHFSHLFWWHHAGPCLDNSSLPQVGLQHRKEIFAYFGVPFGLFTLGLILVPSCFFRYRSPITSSCSTNMTLMTIHSRRK